MLDILIKNGWIIDGTGKERFVGDIGIKNDQLIKIAPYIDLEAALVIDASGLIVAPGLLDNHSHADILAPLGLSGFEALEQGITTQIAGHCGTASVPFNENYMQMFRNVMSLEQWQHLKTVCRDFSTYTSCLENTDLAANLACYVAHGAVREHVMGFQSRSPSQKEMTEMLSLLRQGMECGYLGFSTGLVYAPSVYAGEDEILCFARLAAEYGGGYTSHIRNEGDLVEQAICEAIRVGKKTGIPVTISHLKQEGRKNWGNASRLLKLIDEANADGVCVVADQYPYTAGSAPLIDQIPPRFLTEGKDVLLNKLTDRVLREEIEQAIWGESIAFESAIYCAGYEGTTIVYADGQEHCIGKSIAQIAQESGKRPIDVLCDLLIVTNGNVQGSYFAQSQEDVKTIMCHPLVMCGTDWIGVSKRYAEDTIGGIHPRAIGTMPCRISMLRDAGYRMEDILRSLTGLPAEVAGLDCVGLLEEGRQADVLIFDENKIAAEADYLHPYRSNTGIEYVLVRGKLSVVHGRTTGCKNGRFLHRSRTSL